MEWRYAPYWSGCCESTFTLQLRFHLTMEEEFFSAEEPELGGHDFVFVDELSLGQICPICLVAIPYRRFVAIAFAKAVYWGHLGTSVYYIFVNS